MVGFKLNTARLVACFALAVLEGCGGAPNGPVAAATEVSLPLLELEGGSYEIGLAHGRLLKEQIHEIIGIWKEANAASLGMAPDEFVSLLLEGTDYLPAIKQYTPWLLSEVRGIADGAGMDFNSVLAFQLLDEAGLNSKLLIADKCSALGLDRAENEPALVAQNMDLEGFRNGYQAVLRIKNADTGVVQLVFTCAGLIATNGMNDHGVGVCVNALTQLDHQLTGLPVAFVIRGLLEQPGQDEAIEFVTSVEHASGQNYMIGGPERVVSFECSHGEVAQYLPEVHPGRIYHTNHPFANADYTNEYSAELAAGKDPVEMDINSVTRFATVERMLNESDGADRAMRVREILSSGHPEHPVCQPYKGPGEIVTFGSAIMLLGEIPVMHVAGGPPDSLGYEVFGFN